jgi:hypothetical protein
MDMTRMTIDVIPTVYSTALMVDDEDWFYSAGTVLYNYSMT